MAEIVAGEQVNNPTPKKVDAHSKFDLSYGLFGTYRFGEYAPDHVAHVLGNDKYPLRQVDNTRSFSLGAPLMEDIYMKREHFFVPQESLLPRTWDLILDNPTFGDDVNAALVNTNVHDFTSMVKSVFQGLLAVASADDITNSPEDFLTHYFRALFFGEMFYSHGCLLSALGCHLAPLCFKTGSPFYVKPSSLDEEIDGFMSMLVSAAGANSVIFVYKDGDGVSHTVANNPEYESGQMSLREFIERVRDDMRFQIITVPSPVATQLDSYVPTDFTNGWNISVLTKDEVNIDVCAAYQICCAHYFSNDHIDYIYSANLWREYLGSFLLDCYEEEFGDRVPFSFNYNGTYILYDWLSAKWIQYILLTVVNPSYIVDPAFYNPAFAYLQAIFSFKRSLKYQDYFTGARSNPLAVGDVNVNVNANLVNVVDVTRKIQVQRFLNAVNRTGRRFSEYLKGIFNVDKVSHDWHEPLWLAQTSDKVYAAEVENTGDAQMSDPNSVTSALRLNSSNFAFEFDCDRPGIIISIRYYDIPRSYWQTIERTFFHTDRFDMFNPFLQTIGDQEIYGNELSSRSSKPTFAYTLRHMEYKQRYNECFGGFASGVLKGWAFLADSERSSSGNVVISPDYIRSYPSELDPFFLALTGYSLSSYFHFISKTNNIADETKRNMIYAPSIL